MNADRWSDLVEKGRDLVRQEGDTKWALGDLALEAQHFHGVEAQHFRGDLLRYAEEIGIALHTLRRYRDVAVAWPPALRSAGHPWSVYKELAAAPDRVRLIQSRDRWTVEEARQAVGHAPPRQAPTPKQRAATVKAALADPKIAREVVRDTRSAAQISRAFRAEGRQQVKAAEDRAAERNPALPTYGAAHHLNMARGRIVDAAKEVQRMNNPRDELVLRGIEQVENALGWLKTLVEGGDPDQELVALLRGR